MLFEARRDGPEVLEFVEEALDEVSLLVEERAEEGDVDPVRHRLDVRPSTLLVDGLAQGIAIVSPVGQQGLARADACQHVGSTAAVVRLAFGEFECDRQPVGIDQGVDLRRQSASRTPHASGDSDVPSRGRGGFRPPFLALAAC